MPTPAQYAASKLYANIIGEIKLRIAAIDTGTTNKLPVSPPLVREFCFLQFRMICELIAFGCLVAHGDISGTKHPKLQKAWEADKIIELLEALHPDFFPIPVVQGRDKVGHTLSPREPNPLPKKEFLDLYRKCGEVLHRGSARKLLSQKEPIRIHYPELTAVAQKFVDLLSVHQVRMLGGKMFFVCILSNAEDNMNVQVAIAEELPDAQKQSA